MTFNIVEAIEVHPVTLGDGRPDGWLAIHCDSNTAATIAVLHRIAELHGDDPETFTRQVKDLIAAPVQFGFWWHEDGQLRRGTHPFHHEQAYAGFAIGLPDVPYT